MTASQHVSILKTLCGVSQICLFQKIHLHSEGCKIGLNCPRFVRALMPRKSFLCKFGIDFAFYNLARCLAWLGSCLCPSLNIFGLKTGSLGWRKDTNRIYIFTTRQSGGLRAGEGELVRHLQLSCRTKHPQLSNIPTPSFLRILACMKIDTGFILHRPRISLHSPHLQPQPPQAPRRAPIMHAADRFKQQVGLPALK